MKNILLPILILIIFNNILYTDETPTRTQELSVKDMQTQNTIIAKMFAEEISKTLPHKVDKYTELMGVSSKKATIVYIFEINTGSKSDMAVIKEDRSRMQRVVTQGICQSSDRFLKADINISYLYRSATSKNKLFQFDVTKNDCNFKL